MRNNGLVVAYIVHKQIALRIQTKFCLSIKSITKVILQFRHSVSHFVITTITTNQPPRWAVGRIGLYVRTL